MAKGTRTDEKAGAEGERKTRSRTGCLTCRRRHIRCDERRLTWYVPLLVRHSETNSRARPSSAGGPTGPTRLSLTNVAAVQTVSTEEGHAYTTVQLCPSEIEGCRTSRNCLACRLRGHPEAILKSLAGN